VAYKMVDMLQRMIKYSGSQKKLTRKVEEKNTENKTCHGGDGRESR